MTRTKRIEPLPGQMEFGFMGPSESDPGLAEPEHLRARAAATGQCAKDAVRVVMIRADDAEPVDPVAAARYRGIATAFHDAWEWGVGLRDADATASAEA